MFYGKRVFQRVLLCVMVAIMIAASVQLFVMQRRPVAVHAQQCPRCNLKPVVPPRSTNRDVVLAAAFGKLKRVEYFFRTLRATGTKCRIILFIDDPTYIQSNWLKFFHMCSIEPVFVNHTSTIVKNNPKLSRYYFYEQWLSIHIAEVDRILHTDTYDVIFQGDPFSLESLTKDSLFFTQEPVSLRKSRWTDGWVRQCYGNDVASKYGKEPVSCSGVTIGGAKRFLEYVSALLDLPKWRTCFGHSLDQAHHNYLIYTQHPDFIFLNCSSQFLTMHFCCKTYKCVLEENGLLKGPTQYPLLIHQYNRWKNLTKRNPVICPPYVSIDTNEEASVEFLPSITRELPTESKRAI